MAIRFINSKSGKVVFTEDEKGDIVRNKLKKEKARKKRMAIKESDGARPKGAVAIEDNQV